MEFESQKSFEILQATPLALREQLNGLSWEWLISREHEQAWSIIEIISHLIHCEEDDWIVRVKTILNNSGDRKFKSINRTQRFENDKSKGITELLTEFGSLRKQNLNILKSRIKETDLNKAGVHPEFGDVTLKQLLAAWVVHDLSHLAQINRTLAKQYKTEVGPWLEYLPILNN